MPRGPAQTDGMEQPTRARTRTPETSQGGPGATELMCSGGQGVQREGASAGPEEQCRAAIEGGSPAAEPVGQRGGKVEPARGRRRRAHAPPAPRCVRGARHGRAARERRSTGSVFGGHRRQAPYARKRRGARRAARSRTAGEERQGGEHRRTEESAPEWGGEDRRRRRVGREKNPEEPGPRGGTVPCGQYPYARRRGDWQTG